MSIKYIRNTDDATIVCKIPSDKNKAFVFRAKRFDKRNNVVISNGFTEVSEVDLNLLRSESSTFKFYEKSGKLSIVDNLPHESMSVEQLVLALKSENALLKKELKTVQIGINSSDLEKKIVELEEVVKAQLVTIDQMTEKMLSVTEKDTEIEQMKLVLQQQQDVIDALNEQIIEDTDKDEDKDKDEEKE